MDSFKEVGLTITHVRRLTNKENKNPTRTIKIICNDQQNRNTFIKTGLQIDSMYFLAEPDVHNIKPVQCYMCQKFNHIAKFCRTKQQFCPRCGDNHHLNECPNTQNSLKCHNCKGNHMSNASECPIYQEQEKKMKKMINHYS